MLIADKDTGRLTATCDKCGSRRGSLGTDRELAETALKNDGWLDAPQKGRGRDRARWWCRACGPKPSSSFGASTGDMKRSG